MVLEKEEPLLGKTGLASVLGAHLI